MFSGDIGVAKPAPEIFHAGAAGLGLAPQQVVYVGDRWATDIVGALSAGLAAVWVNRHGQRRPDDAIGQGRSATPDPPRLAELADLHRLDAELVLGLLAGGPHRIGQRVNGL